jgi:hypothetical protein
VDGRLDTSPTRDTFIEIKNTLVGVFFTVMHGCHFVVIGRALNSPASIADAFSPINPNMLALTALALCFHVK